MLVGTSWGCCKVEGLENFGDFELEWLEKREGGGGLNEGEIREGSKENWGEENGGCGL